MIYALINSDIVTALQTLLATTLLLGIVLFLRRPISRKFGAKAGYALWAIPVIRFIMPPVPERWMSWPKQWTSWNVSESNLVQALATNLPTLAKQVEKIGAPQASQLVDTQTIIPPLQEAQILPVPWVNIFLGVWVAGIIISLVILFYRQNKFAKIIAANARLAPKSLHVLSHQQMQWTKLPRMPDIMLSTVSSSPLVTGLHRPRVLLPSWFEDDYTQSEQSAMLAHEFTHIKRFDLWALQIAHIFVALQWFNPVAYYALRAFRADQEAACDADVLRSGAVSAHDYSAVLLKVVQNSKAVPQRNLVASLPLTHSIKERFILMQNATPNFKTRLLGTTLVCLFGGAALLVSANSIAHPTEHKMQLSFGDDHFMIDGREIKDRRFVMLSNPLDDLGVEEWVEKITDMDFSSLAGLADIVEWDSFKDFPKMSGLRALSKIDFSQLKFEKNNGELVFTIPADGIDLSALPDGFDLKALAKWAEHIEIDSEALNVKINASVMPKMEAFGKRMEERFGDEFHEQVETLVTTYKSLATECADTSFARNAKPIILKTKVNGQTYKAACVKGDAKTLRSNKTAQFIRNHKRLSQAEKDMFFDVNEHGHKMKFNFSDED